MSLLQINTVDRLDRPSAYYAGKVSDHEVLRPLQGLRLAKDQR